MREELEKLLSLVVLVLLLAVLVRYALIGAAVTGVVHLLKNS